VGEIHTPSRNDVIIMHDGEGISITRSKGVLRILGKKYSLLIIGVLGNNNAMSFNDIKKSVGCPRSNLLSVRLKEMGNAGITRRMVVDSSPVSVKYSLTESGKELRENLIPLFRWIEYNCYLKS
jgi:DNA-binding HxlR family transcriptional regulator